MTGCFPDPLDVSGEDGVRTDETGGRTEEAPFPGGTVSGVQKCPRELERSLVSQSVSESWFGVDR